MIDEFFKQRLRVKGRCNSLIVGIYFSWKSPTLECSTIGAVALNDAVRKGKRWNPQSCNYENTEGSSYSTFS